MMLPPGARGNVTYIAPAGEYSLTDKVIEVEFGGVKKVCIQRTGSSTFALHWSEQTPRQQGAVTLQSSLKPRDRTCSCLGPYIASVEHHLYCDHHHHCVRQQTVYSSLSLFTMKPSPSVLVLLYWLTCLAGKWYSCCLCLCLPPVQQHLISLFAVWQSSSRLLTFTPTPGQPGIILGFSSN